jgi:hypothetical protein
VIVLFFVVIVVPVKLRLNHAFVYSQLDFEGTCSHISFGEYSQITFLRTFESRRPPTPGLPTVPSFLSDPGPLIRADPTRARIEPNRARLGSCPNSRLRTGLTGIMLIGHLYHELPLTWRPKSLKHAAPQQRPRLDKSYSLLVPGGSSS